MNDREWIAEEFAEFIEEMQEIHKRIKAENSMLEFNDRKNIGCELMMYADLIYPEGARNG